MFANPAITLSVRILPEIRDQLEELASATGRTKSFLAVEAITAYLSSQHWQIKAIENAVKEADSKTSEFIDHEHVAKWLNSWGYFEGTGSTLMKLVWLKSAVADLQSLRRYIAMDNPIAADHVAQRLLQAATLLIDQPSIGRPGRVSQTRELVISDTPYLIPYRVKNDTVEILRVLHGAMQ